MDLREMLLGTYTSRYQQKAGKQQPAQLHLQAVAKRLKEQVPAGMKVRVSGSGISPPTVPWIAVLNPDVTNTAQEGLYVVYLYREDLSALYLSMNQGVTQHQLNARAAGRKNVAKEARQTLATEARLIRSQLSAESLKDLEVTIDLHTTVPLPRAYEAGNIAAIRYDLQALPSADELMTDLRRMLTLYDNCVEIKNEILQSSPGELQTTPVAKKVIRNATPKPPAFRPKSATDYVANIGAQTQVRQRRHETLVKDFGDWSKGLKLIPATNVHPRDLTITAPKRAWLVEAKVVGPNAALAVREAIGQLFAYRHFYYRTNSEADPGLIALFTEPVGDAFVELLLSLGIEAIWREGEFWNGKAPAGTLGLIDLARSQRPGDGITAP